MSDATQIIVVTAFLLVTFGLGCVVGYLTGQISQLVKDSGERLDRLVDKDGDAS